MINRRRLPSASYYPPDESEKWSRECFAQQPIAVLGEEHDALHIARHVANKQASMMPFFVMDVPAVEYSLDLWETHMPRVRSYYALRCNPDPVLTKFLADSDIGFEVTNCQELEMALELAEPSSIIFNNPLWIRKAMRRAGSTGVDTVVVGDEKSLLDAVTYAPQAKILLALSLGLPPCGSVLSTAAGCDEEMAVELIQTAADLCANLQGFSVQLTASGQDSECMIKSLRVVKKLVGMAQKLRLPVVTVALGGGFPSTKREKHDKFVQVTGEVQYAVAEVFSDDSDLVFCASPGRFLAESAFVLCTNVIGKQALQARHITNDDFDDGVGFVYQINDGVFGSFGCRLLDVQPQCRPLHESIAETSEPEHVGTVLGPSLECGDVAQKLVRCRQLSIGEWLVWEDMGAYSIPLEADYPVPPVYYYAGKDNWERIRDGRRGSSSRLTEQDEELTRATSAMSQVTEESSRDSSDVESVVSDDDDHLGVFFDLASI